MAERAKQRVVLTGATGMVGAELLELSLKHPEVAAVLAVGRRAIERADAKLSQLEHADFADCAPLADRLGGVDVAFFCLGVYTGAVPDAQFRAITVDYVIEFAEALRVGSPGAAFCLLSGAGADQSERSRMAFARYKGAVEKALLAMGFPRVHLFRPAYIHPSTPRAAPNFGYRVSAWLYPLVRRLAPNQVIPSRALAAVMLEVGLHGAGERPPELENRDIRAMAEAVGEVL